MIDLNWPSGIEIIVIRSKLLPMYYSEHFVTTIAHFQHTLCSGVQIFLCMLDKFSCFYCGLLTIFKSNFFKNFYADYLKKIVQGYSNTPRLYSP